uniref:Toll-like receptor 1 n=1 Tax=Labrus bergylta TaxID=56723 RepID=A0A3Q3E0Q4_9LABR
YVLYYILYIYIYIFTISPSLLGASFPDSFVDRSSKNLSSVPQDLTQTVEFLDLSCNHIHLEEIDTETFLDTPLLKELDLSHNRLRNLSGQQYLLYTQNLQVLNLTSNQFLAMTLGSEFISLVNLERFAIGAKNICMGDFKSIAAVKLHTLTLSLEDELKYEAGSLRQAHAKRLQISFTKYQIIDHDLLADAVSVFPEVELMNLLDGYQDMIRLFKEGEEIHTSHLYLTNLSITWDDLTDTVNEVLATSIAHLSFCDVTLSKLPYKGTAVAKTSQMKSFTARRVVVTSFLFSQEDVYNFFINLPVESVALLEVSIIHMTCPQSHSPLLHLDFSYCALSDSIFSRVEGQETVDCETLVNIRRLNLLGNNLMSLQVISKRLKHMSSLREVDLSINSLVYDGLKECSWPPSITNMTLSSNGLTDSVFKCLPNGTETLDLQNNQILVIPSSIMKLSNLSSLNLNFNRLRDLPPCNGFPSINTLLLRLNSLHTPSVNQLESCPKLKTLDVRIELLGWPLDYYCTYPEVMRNSTLKEILIPEISCNAGLLAATILFPSVALIITILTLCHCLDVPWYIGMIWQWTRAKHRARTRQVRPEDLVGIEFHAFVSYSQQDADWVHNFLLPNLEGPAGGLRICHHERNFVPGKTIIENIVTCVEKCQRSVFVLSGHFVKSEWCHYELYFASHQRLVQGSGSIVLVLLEPLPQYLIPSKYYQLKSMMERHTYLEWPQDRAKHRLFWANLRAALQADLPNAPVTELEG